MVSACVVTDKFTTLTICKVDILDIGPPKNVLFIFRLVEYARWSDGPVAWHRLW